VIKEKTAGGKLVVRKSPGRLVEIPNSEAIRHVNFLLENRAKSSGTIEDAVESATPIPV